MLFDFSKAMAEFIPKIGCISLQTRILGILLCYMNNKINAPEKNIVDLFSDIIDKSHWIFTELAAIDKLNNPQKHRLLYRRLVNIINTIGKQVTSKVVKFLYIDGEMANPYPVSGFGCDCLANILNLIIKWYIDESLNCWIETQRQIIHV